METIWIFRMTNCICKNIYHAVDFSHFIQLGSSSTSNIKAVVTVITPTPICHERRVQHKLKHARVSQTAGFSSERWFVTFVCIISCSAGLSEMDGIGNTMQKKAAELERMAEVLVTGEQLR